MTAPTEFEHIGEAQNEMEHTVLSTANLLKATLVAGLLAVVVLTTAILPAEYGIDPTGIGKAMGLTPLAAVVTPVQSLQSAQGLESTQDQAFREDSVDITIPAKSGLEYKFQLEKGETMRYSWTSAGDALFFDFHGEPEGDTSGYFESYTVSTSDDVRGSLTASFEGSHGWYWKNESQSPIVVTLKTEGQYEIIGVK